MNKYSDQLAVEHEGIILHVYKDNRGIWTLGCGTNVDKDHGGGISYDDAMYLLHSHQRKDAINLDKYLPWWRELSEIRQAVLLDMCYNLGIYNLRRFVNTLDAMKNGKYVSAASGMRNSKWHGQVGNRAERLALMMETDVFIKKWW